MRRSTKFGCAIAAIAGISLISAAMGLGIYMLANFNTGMTLGKEGYAAMMAAHYDRAIASFDAALQKNLTSSWRAWIYLSRGTSANHLSRFDEAIHDITEAL